MDARRGDVSAAAGAGDEPVARSSGDTAGNLSPDALLTLLDEVPADRLARVLGLPTAVHAEAMRALPAACERIVMRLAEGTEGFDSRLATQCIGVLFDLRTAPDQLADDGGGAGHG